MEKNILDIYKDELLYSKNITDAFYEYAKKNFIPYHVNNKKNREIELVFKNPSFYWFSILYNYEEKDVKSYIEIKNTISKEFKTRFRKDINSFSFYINNKKELINLFNRETQESKYFINSEDYGENLIFKTADESVGTITYDPRTKLQFYYVNSLSLRNSYFKIEIRMKTLLKSQDEKNNDLIMSYFQPSNDKRFIDMEIELNQQLTKLDEKEFKNKFHNIMCYGVTGPRYGFYFYFKPPLIYQIKTNMINIGELLEMDYSSSLVTKKIDGVSKHFYVRNSICYIVNNYVLTELETNIPPEYELAGTGEYVILNNRRVIFPFWFEAIVYKKKNINFKTRLESFKYFDKILKETTKKIKNTEYVSKLKNNEKNGIIFSSKEFAGPFDDREDFLNNCFRLYTSESDFMTDGIVIIKNNEVEKEKIIDFKFKQHNTIDVYTNFSLPEKLDDDMTSLNFTFNIYLKIKDKKTNKDIKNFCELFKLKQSSSTLFYYDNKISMLIYKKDVIFEVYPVTFIAELNITDNKSFIPRLDKTSKMFNKNKYYGNNITTIINSIVLHKYKFSVSQSMFKSILDLDEEKLKKYILDTKEIIKDKTKEELNNIISNKGQETEYDDTKLSDEEEDVENIFTPLNVNKNWYKEESNINSRSNLNHLSNLNKTIGLNIAISPFLNETAYKTLFSIYCGKGGDMGKFVTQGIKTVVGIDPDKNALAQFAKRHKSYSETKNKTFSLTLIPLSLEDKNFMLKVKKKTGEMTYDVVDCQLGIHFSFNKETEDHIGEILVALSNKNKTPKTKLVISTNDKENIMNLFTKKKTNVLSFRIDEKNTYIVSKKSDDKVDIFYEASMNEAMEEHMIDKKYFISFLENLGFKLIQTWNFNEVIENKEIYDDLFHKYERESSKNFMRNLKNININDFDLKELLSIFRYYIFEYKF